MVDEILEFEPSQDVSISDDSVVNSEKTIQATSNVSLLNISDFIYSSTNTDCKTKFTNYACDNNWLALEDRFYFLNGKINDSNAQIWTNKDNYSIDNNGTQIRNFNT